MCVILSLFGVDPWFIRHVLLLRKKIEIYCITTGGTTHAGHSSHRQDFTPIIQQTSGKFISPSFLKMYSVQKEITRTFCSLASCFTWQSNYRRDHLSFRKENCTGFHRAVWNKNKTSRVTAHVFCVTVFLNVLFSSHNRWFKCFILFNKNVHFRDCGSGALFVAVAWPSFKGVRLNTSRTYLVTLVTCITREFF